MIRFFVSGLLLITCFVFQGTVFEEISFAGTVPNLLLILTVSLGLMRGRKTGMLLGFFSGIMMDVFIGSNIGLYALIYMYIGYANGYFHKVFFPEDVKLPIGMIIFSDLFYGFICYVLLFLLRGRLDFGFYFVHVIIPECIYTIIVTVFLYPLIFLINKLLERVENRGAKKFV